MSDNEFVSGSSLAKAVIWLFGTAIAMQFIATATYVHQIMLLQRIDRGDMVSNNEVEFSDYSVSLISVLDFLVYLAGAIVFLFWLYRVSANLPALGVQDMRWSPGWAVGWWFIPVMNIFRPYQVVKEIWLASSADAQPGAWRDGPVSSILGLWWLVFLAGRIVIAIASRMNRSTGVDIDAYISAFVLHILGGLIWAFGAYLAIKIIREIDRRQSLPRVTKYAEAFA